MKNVALQGSHYLTEDESVVGMLALYLHKSNIPITAGKIRKEIISITKTVIKEGGLPKSGLIFPSSKTGSLQLSIPKVVLSRTMKMVSETNCSYFHEWENGESCSYILESEKISFDGGHIFFILVKRKKYGSIKIFPYTEFDSDKFYESHLSLLRFNTYVLYLPCSTYIYKFPIFVKYFYTTDSAKTIYLQDVSRVRSGQRYRQGRGNFPG